jgi:predicted naringenin-chalcone synthase
MDTTPRILSVATDVPSGRMTQVEVYEGLAEHFPRYRDRRIQRIFEASGIETRHFVLGRENFDPLADADALHRVYQQGALAIGEAAARKCLGAAGVGPQEVDYIVATTCTGYVCPGLSARLGRALGMRDDLQRADLVGMGCAGSMPSLQRAHDFVRAYPDRRALIVTVEISSACWYVDDSLETVVGNTICADGAAAALVGAGEPGSGPALERFSTLLDFDFIESVGLEFKAGKQRIVLSKDVRSASGPLVRQAVERLLKEASLAFAQVDHWVIHSGGKRVLDAIDGALGFRNGELAHSRAVLREFGNMSSPTLMFVLERTLRDAQPGEIGVLVALGPGLAAETGMIRW